MKIVRSAIKSNSFKGYASTYIVEFLVLVSNLLVYKLCTAEFGNKGLADLSIYKRLFSFAQPILLLGLLIGVTRYVTHAKSKSEQFSYYYTSFIFFLLISVILFIAFIPLNEFWSQFLFNDNSFKALIMPMAVSISGIYFHLMTYGYLRGKHEYIYANYLQFINMAMVPIVAFFIVDTLPKVLFITGIGWLLFSFISFLIIILNKENSTNLKFNFKHLKTLLTYSLPRVPGDIAFGGLFALPIIIVSHFNYPELAGKMAFSITLLNIVGAAFSPLSLMLLPGISQKLKDKNYKAVMIETKRAIFATVILSGIGLTIYQLFAEEILHLYLGEDVAFWVTDTKIIMSGAVFYALFITLRSVIDAYYVKAVNSINLIISMLFFCLSSIIVGSLEFDYVWFYISFLTSLTLLMILTLLSINKMNKELKLLL